MLKKLQPVEPTFNSWSCNRPVYHPKSSNFSPSKSIHFGGASELDRIPSQDRPTANSSGHHPDNSLFARGRDWNSTQHSLFTIRSDDFSDCKLPPIRSPALFAEENLGSTTSPSTSSIDSRSSSYAAMSSNDSCFAPPLDNSRTSSTYQFTASPSLDVETSPHASKSSCPSNDKTACHYMGPCETGAPPRKVVSQIFGRNKICTREIPEDLWPVYCRKHYQRHKYRNAEGFARTQCDLVLTTVERLDSRCNVKDYTIVLRKKEATKFMNLEANSTADNKGLNRNSDHGSSNEAILISSNSSPISSREFIDHVSHRLTNGGEGRNGNNREGNSIRATATPLTLAPRPFKLSDFAGEGQIGKSSAYVRDVIFSIRAAIEAKALTEFPGIEILPNFGSQNNPASQRKPVPRKKTRRSISGSQHVAIPGTSVITMKAAPEQYSSPDSSPIRSSRLQGRGFVTRASQRDLPRDLAFRARTLQRGLNPADH
ncbi:MAG: hypothetical protein M1812_006937 [Candelaria pacifica]|nr:MAG: hypothetical protein M1812_006937 [Candelaria pacifica]